jgi:hypothetical protein
MPIRRHNVFPQLRSFELAMRLIFKLATGHPFLFLYVVVRLPSKMIDSKNQIQVPFQGESRVTNPIDTILVLYLILIS